ncbi:hypothetical protein REPUB_Repub12eG0208100 [Reevesia pubescens]
MVAKLLTGPVFMYSTGNIQFLCVTDVEMVKEINLCTSLSLGKPSFLSKYFGPLLGEGILASSDPLWAHHRKIIAPVLYVDKVKGMVNLMVESTNSMIRSWQKRVQRMGGLAEIEVDQNLRSLSADLISRACFGSSYSKGEEIFCQIRTLQKVMTKGKSILGLPGLRLFPTKNNREKWKLEKEVNSKILEVVKQRIEAGHEKDFLQMILEAAHPDWQDRVRSEVLEICKGGILDSDMLQSMEVLTLHQITDLWGHGAHQFNPERFATGVLGACKHPQAYLPFGVGARTCVGQQFAMTELKVVLSLILSKFCFSLSPAYQHSPVTRMILEPEHGIRLMCKEIMTF